MAGLLNVGEMGALALHVLVELTIVRKKDADARMTVQELAAALKASVHTLQKVARRLVVVGLAEGTRGAGGGLRLAADPEGASMLDILESVEGKIRGNRCLFANRVCSEDKRCLLDDITGTMEQMVRDRFAQTTLADLAAAAEKQDHR